MANIPLEDYSRSIQDPLEQYTGSITEGRSGSEYGQLSTEDASAEIGGTVAGTLGQIAGTAIQAGVQSSQTDKVRQQALSQAEERAAMIGKQEDISFRYQKEGLRQEQKAQDLRELQDTYVQRFNGFVRSFKKKQQTRQQQTKLAKGISERASQNDNLANFMINNWGK